MLTPLDPSDPTEVGPYRLHGRLGAGGMGVVYQGFSPDGRAVAIKLPHDEVAADPEFRSRFEQEVTAARRVRGGFVAEVLDADVNADRPWMATQYVDGVSLADAVRYRGPLAGVALVGLAAGLADALVAIHAAGVVHRDLKPSNVIMAWDGPKVIDFGIARTLDASNQTATGILVGTVAWMAPEQLSGERAGASADVFAWAACVAYAATGRHPFAAESQAATVGRILGGDPELAGMPPSLEYLVRRALSKAPELRPTPTQLVATVAGRTVSTVEDAEHAATRIVRGAPPGPTPPVPLTSASSPPPPPPPPTPPTPPQAPTRVETNLSAGAADVAGLTGAAWDGWQTPPPSPEQHEPPTPLTPPLPAQPQQPASSPQLQPQPQLQRPRAPAQLSAVAAVWWPRSAPVPLVLRVVLGVAAVLAAIPVLFRAPSYLPAEEIWGLYQEFGLAFLAFPLAAAALALGQRYPPLRDGAAGTALGLSVLVFAEAATIRQRSSGEVGAGWWLLVVGAIGTFAAVVVWRGTTTRWSPGRWSLAGCALLAFGVLLFSPEDQLWEQSLFTDAPRSDGDATAMVVAAGTIGLFVIVTFVASAGGPNFFMALAAATICGAELARVETSPQVFAAGSASVVVGLLLFGLVLDRAADRLMLLTARVAVAVTYLRAEILPTLPWRADVANAYLLATGMIILLAVVAARWRRLPPAAPPGWPPGGYGDAGQNYAGQNYGGQSYPSQSYPGQNYPAPSQTGHHAPGWYPGRQPPPGPGGYYGQPPYYR